MNQINPKIIFLIVISICRTCPSACQKVNIAFESNNFTYLHFPTPLTITASNIDCQQIYAIVDQGKIEKDGCDYIFYPNKVGLTTIEVFQKTGKTKRLLSKETIQVKKPKPIIFICPYAENCDTVQSEIIKRQEFLRAELPGVCSEYMWFRIDSFHYKIIYKDSSICEGVNLASKFSDSIINCFAKLTYNDLIIIYKIYGKLNSGDADQLEPSIFMTK